MLLQVLQVGAYTCTLSGVDPNTRVASSHTWNAATQPSKNIAKSRCRCC